jgi:hypothetical protein
LIEEATGLHGSNRSAQSAQAKIGHRTASPTTQFEDCTLSQIYRGPFMIIGLKSVVSVAAFLISMMYTQACAQSADTGHDIGIVYYAYRDGFKALSKETVVQSGRSKYAARVKGAHATIRLPEDQPLKFRVCGVDPSRFKLFRFKSENHERTLLIAEANMLIGGSKTVISDSEIPVTIDAADGGCFTLTPKTTLGDGEFGFSPVESLDAFMFGIGDVNQSK